MVKVQVVGGGWIHGDSKNGRRKKETGAIVCRGAREEEFLSITVRGGDAGFYLGKSRRTCFGRDRGTESGGWPGQSTSAVTPPCRSWLKSHRRG